MKPEGIVQLNMSKSNWFLLDDFDAFHLAPCLEKAYLSENVV